MFNTIAPDRRNDAEFRKMGADRIDHCGLLTDEQMAGAVEHQAALLLERLSRYKPHVCSGDRFANGFSVCSIVLLPLDIGLHVRRRHQAHSMPGAFELAGPTMRRSAGFDAMVRRQLLKEWQNVTALELTGERLHYLPRQLRGFEKQT